MGKKGAMCFSTLFVTCLMIYTIEGSCTWNEFPDKRISYDARDLVRDVSFEDCLIRCQMRKSFKCVAVSYLKAHKVCYMYTISYAEAKHKGHIKSSSYYSIRAEVCKGDGHEDSVTTTTTTAAPSRLKCKWTRYLWRTISGYSLPSNKRVSSLEECKYMCENEAKYDCTAFIYAGQGGTNTYCGMKSISLPTAISKKIFKYSSYWDTWAATDCKKEPTRCTWKTYAKVYIRGETKYSFMSGKTVKECRTFCETTNSFNCASFSYEQHTRICYFSDVSYSKAQQDRVVKTDDRFQINECEENSEYIPSTSVAPAPQASSCYWEIYPNTYIAMNTIKSLKGTSFSQYWCRNQCQSTDKCVSFDFEKRGYCHLSELSYSEGAKKQLLRTNTGYDLYEYICQSSKTVAPPPSSCTWQTYNSSYIAMNNNADYKYTLLEECKRYCEEATDFQCVSIDYDAVKKHCFLSAMSYAEAKQKRLIRTKPHFYVMECEKN